MSDNNFVPKEENQNAGAPQNGAQNQQQFQQQFQHNINPQQYQQYQRPCRPITNTVVDFIPKIVLTFLVLSGLAFAYNFILGVIRASQAYQGGFREFIAYLTVGISSASKYLFYAAILSLIEKISKK
ncbi:hypothetical protein SAMN02745248_01572 [Hathewaya proteolytica DSM 3090]|uniref:Uncharacterized protein n=1 Tax=Hathewaya proteolytica DSM 3090 TaxID=1121331 RepID=A0A1M6NZU9_9CLOT|nr:hypothetical protein [Hathewaya proteolytica]SHK01184.1 hypothetical protein SAMN02745248_01572 [Hathewaya proteolytica DSM 3090]